MFLYHGTSSNRAHKIINKGFRPGSDGAVFFAEDRLTAQYFALTVKTAPDETPPQNFTILIFDIPDSIVQKLFARGLTGQFRDAPLIQISPVSSPYEYVLNGSDAIREFNNLFLNVKQVSFKRWRIL
jgi:hypothetical protein